MKEDKWAGQEAINQDKAEALEFGVGLSQVGLQRHQVTDEVWHLLKGSYAFGINPLPILRKAMPNFEWKFHDLLDKENIDEAIRARVVESDFFWFAGDFHDQLVTARRTNSNEKPFMIIGQTFQSLLDSCVPGEEMVHLLQAWGVKEDREEHTPH